MLHLISFFPGALDGNYGEKSALSVSAFQVRPLLYLLFIIY
jgi:hypothetical protein